MLIWILNKKIDKLLLTRLCPSVLLASYDVLCSDSDLIIIIVVGVQCAAS